MFIKLSGSRKLARSYSSSGSAFDKYAIAAKIKLQKRLIPIIVGHLTKAQVTPSYDVIRWDEILDIHDCPRLGYDITILVLWSHWIRCVCDVSGTIVGKLSDILRPSYKSHTRSYDFTTIVCREADIIVGSRVKSRDAYKKGSVCQS